MKIGASGIAFVANLSGFRSGGPIGQSVSACCSTCVHFWTVLRADQASLVIIDAPAANRQKLEERRQPVVGPLLKEQNMTREHMLADSLACLSFVRNSTCKKSLAAPTLVGSDRGERAFKEAEAYS